MIIRTAEARDLEAMIALIQRARVQLKSWLPKFWNPSAQAEEMTRFWFGHLLAHADQICLVHETGGRVDGFLIAGKQVVPPVYDPGGEVFTVDDFHVDDGLWASAGNALIDEAFARLRARGVTQVIFICAERLKEKSDLLVARGLNIAAQWWTTPL